MNIDAFEKLFGTWFEMFKPFLESPEFEKIWNGLKEKIQRGKVIYPYSSTLKAKHPKWISENTIFRCFKETSVVDLKVIIVGLSPYFTSEDNVPVADGLAFSTKTKKEPPSLTALYNAIQDDVYGGVDKDMSRNPNLEFLTKQGVMLLNCALTCEPSMPTIHCELWEPFMKFFFKEIINKYFNDVHIVFMGEEAQKYMKYVQQKDESTLSFNNTQYVYKENHPSYYARIQERMDTDIFSKINTRLIKDYEKTILWDENSLKEDILPF